MYMSDKVLAKIMSRKGGMLVMEAYPWPIIYDTAAETSIFCASTHRPKGVELERVSTNFFSLTGLRVGDVELPPVQCQMSDQTYKDPSSVFEYSPLILGMNFLTYSVPAPLVVDYANSVCGWGFHPKKGVRHKKVKLQWVTPRNGLGNRAYLKRNGRTADFLKIEMILDGKDEPYVIDTGACCVIDNSGKHTEKRGHKTHMSNFEGKKITTIESTSNLCSRACEGNSCEQVCMRVPTRHAQSATGKENLLGNAGLKVLTQDGSALFIYPHKKSPFLVIGT